MAWIEVHQSLTNHRKTLALADALDIPPVHAMGHLVALWLWSIDNAPDGRLDNVKPRTIALAAQWTGDPAAFIDALTESSFLESDGGGFIIHDWMDYAGRLVERRAENAKRMRDARAKNRTHVIEERAENVQDTCVARAGATGPNRTGPDLTSITNVIDASPTPTASKFAAPAAPPDGGKKAPTVSQRMWDVLKDHLGHEPHADNKPERGAWNGAIRSLLNIGETPDTLPALIEQYQLRWPGIDCTPPALVKNHSLIRSAPPTSNGKHAAPEPVYLTPEDHETRIREELEWAATHTIPPNYQRTKMNGSSSHPASSTSSRTSRSNSESA